MCGRFALKAPPAELVTRFGLDECADFGPRYNIPPGTDIPVSEIVRTVCIVTTGANELMAPIHDRMPVLIAPEHWRTWLTAPADVVRQLLAPSPSTGMRAWPVSRRVSRTADDDPELIEPLPDETSEEARVS